MIITFLLYLVYLIFCINFMIRGIPCTWNFFFPTAIASCLAEWGAAEELYSIQSAEGKPQPQKYYLQQVFCSYAYLLVGWILYLFFPTVSLWWLTVILPITDVLLFSFGGAMEEITEIIIQWRSKKE